MRILDVAKGLAAMLAEPIRIRLNPPAPPFDPTDYAVPELAPHWSKAKVLASDIPRGAVSVGGSTPWPPRLLADCDEPLSDGAPDLRGVWQVYRGPLKGHVERTEQSGERIVITADGVMQDLVVDGALTAGVGAPGSGSAPAAIAARYEDGRLNLYLGGDRLVSSRHRDGDELIWRWGPYTNRLRRLEAPSIG